MENGTKRKYLIGTGLVALGGSLFFGINSYINSRNIKDKNEPIIENTRDDSSDLRKIIESKTKYEIIIEPMDEKIEIHHTGINYRNNSNDKKLTLESTD